MKISVIVPVYNRLEHFRALFLSLIKQQRKPYELIITDDGSKENIIEFIGDLISKADFTIKHVYQYDKGFRKTRALNNGVRYSNGDFLVFCDQDLVFGSDYLENVSELGNDNEFLHFRPVSLTQEERNIFLKEAEKISFNYSEFISHLNPKYKISLNRTLKKDRTRRILNKFHLNKRGIKLVGMSYALSKKNYEKINGYDERYQGWGHEDDDFGNRLSAAGITGREVITKDMQLHLWHPFDPTKKKSANEEYYKNRKNEIFKNADYFCKYGYNNSLEKDEVTVSILKEVNI